MARPKNVRDTGHTTLLYALLADGCWHTMRAVRAAVGNHVIPGVAMRAYLAAHRAQAGRCKKVEGMAAQVNYGRRVVTGRCVSDAMRRGVVERDGKGVGSKVRITAYGLLKYLISLPRDATEITMVDGSVFIARKLPAASTGVKERP